MKLDARQVESIEKQTGFKPLPDEAASESGLADAFGDQTFYVDPNGIYVFEPVETPGSGEPMMAIQIAEVERVSPREDDGGNGGNGRDSGEVIVSAVEPRTTSLVVDIEAA